MKPTFNSSSTINIQTTNMTQHQSYFNQACLFLFLKGELNQNLDSRIQNGTILGLSFMYLCLPKYLFKPINREFFRKIFSILNLKMTSPLICRLCTRGIRVSFCLDHKIKIRESSQKFYVPKTLIFKLMLQLDIYVRVCCFKCIQIINDLKPIQIFQFYSLNINSSYRIGLIFIPSKYF